MVRFRVLRAPTDSEMDAIDAHGLVWTPLMKPAIGQTFDAIARTSRRVDFHLPIANGASAWFRIPVQCVEFTEGTDA